MNTFLNETLIFIKYNWRNINYNSDFLTKNFKLPVICNASLHSIIFNSKLSCILEEYSRYFLEEILPNWLDNSRVLELAHWTIVPPIFFLITSWFIKLCLLFAISRLPKTSLHEKEDWLFRANHSLSHNKFYQLKQGVNYLEEAYPEFPWRTSWQLYFAFEKKTQWMLALICNTFTLSFVLCFQNFQKIGCLKDELTNIYITKLSYFCYILSYVTFCQLLIEILLILFLSLYFKHVYEYKKK